MGILHEDRYMFLIVSLSIVLRMKKKFGQISREKQNTHFMLNNFFFLEIRAI
jgi:hypothetical protein